MKNILIEIEYDGTAYCGWQIQSNGISIQQKIEEAIFDLTGRKTRINGSGRTDAGVHALGQTATFMTDSGISSESMAMALNSRLQDDISIIGSEEVPESFHARYSAKGKVYRYRIFNRRAGSPFEENRSFRYSKSINIENMKDAAKSFIGTHDFRSFMASGSSVEETIRTICRLDIDKTGNTISMEIEGNGFLYKMVRIIAGTLLECGTGKAKPNEIPKIIESCSRQNAGRTLPGYGLYLVRVIY